MNKFNTSLVHRHEQFKVAQVDKNILHSCLRTMGRDYLKNKKMEWSYENPTRNYCYVVTEWLCRYKLHASYYPTPFKLVVDDDTELHYFVGLQTIENDPETSEIKKTWAVIDLTREQFPLHKNLDYEQAKKIQFMKTAGPQPSKRAQLLEHLYNGGNINNFEYLNKEAWAKQNG